MDDAIALVVGHARAEIDPACGGALASYSFGVIDVLRPTPAATRDVRLHGCYPFLIHRAADARHRTARGLRGISGTTCMPSTDRMAAPVDHSRAREREALLALDHDAEGEAAHAWPWPLRAIQALSLRVVDDAEGAVLALKLRIANPGASAFPFGLGWHPFFVRSATTQIGFRARGVWETDATRLPTVHAAVPSEWRFDPARSPGSATIDNVFTGWDGEATLFEKPGIAVNLQPIAR
jgi:aldose 1-epimerase